ncbi:MAG: sigma factor-like helix-turn-helix DNA-binding protein [Clostridia bacterium]|nr:sigma factor-like helix-turn-helix DNA-binding protein [Clostridia bacterium]
MENRVMMLDDFTESIFSLSNYNISRFDGEDMNYRKMLRSLKNVLYGELTERQRKCILLYYGEKMKMKDISIELEISVSSVSRHIKKAKYKVEKTMKYYF